MALRARLIPTPPRPPDVWIWHTAEWATVRASKIQIGNRRMEGQTYLSSGYGIRQAIEGRPTGWVSFGEMADVWMPGRLKGIQVGPGHGTPFLAATQVFDLRPVSRKWLALARTSDAENRFVKDGMILVTCSGTVGRSTLAYSVLKDTLISHDLLRVEARNQKQWGWLYAYLQSPQAKAMAVGSHYGQIIKHLEPEHLQQLPIPSIDDRLLEKFALAAQTIINLRNESYRLSIKAESVFARALGWSESAPVAADSFTVGAASLFRSRRRLDAANHSPVAAGVRKYLATHGRGFTAISAAGYDVWLPTRFRRVPAREGVWLWDSSSLTEVNPQPTKRIADKDFGDKYRGRVEAGWVLMARSGQVYGIIGATVLASSAMEGNVISDHVMRIKPTKPTIRPGYLVTAMSHPTLGRPLVKALAYGSSVPEIELADIAAFEVVRLDEDVESEIAAIADAAAKSRADADILEQSIGRQAGEIIDEFMKRPRIRLVGITVGEDDPDAAAKVEKLVGQWIEERPRGGNVHRITETPAYRSIIEMGERALRPLLMRLRRKPEHLFHALHEITEENPIPASAEGKIKLMADAWVQWGKSRGYLGDMD